MFFAPLASVAVPPQKRPPPLSHTLAAFVNSEDRSENGLAYGRLQLIHIPKTGGTTLETVGKKHGMLWGKYRNDWPGGRCPHGCEGTWQPCSAWHVPPAAFTSKAIRADHDPYALPGRNEKFTAVRNPYTRAISEHLFANGRCSATALNDHVLTVLNKIKDAVAELERDPQKMTMQALQAAGRPTPYKQRSSDCHWLPQALYVGTNNKETVLRTENLEGDFRTMVEAHGFTFNANDFAVKQNVQHTKCALLVGDLNSTSRTMLQQVYANDFRRFGYSTELLNSRNHFEKELQRSNSSSSRDTLMMRVFEDDQVFADSCYPDCISCYPHCSDDTRAGPSTL